MSTLLSSSDLFSLYDIGGVGSSVLALYTFDGLTKVFFGNPVEPRRINFSTGYTDGKTHIEMLSLTESIHFLAREDKSVNQSQLVVEGSHNLILCGHPDRDFLHQSSTDPTLWIHSITNPAIDATEWLKLLHDGSNGIIGVGKGHLVAESSIGIGLPDSLGNATNVLGIANGTAPSAAITGAALLAAADTSDGKASLSIWTEQTVEAIGTVTASSKLKITINGVEMYLLLASV